MAVTLDTTGSSETSPLSLTVADNPNRILIVSYSQYQGGAAPDGITYNGSALTAIIEQEGDYGEYTGIFGIIAPDTGTHDIAVSGTTAWWGIGAISLYGVDQTLPHNVTSINDVTQATLTTGHDGSWVVSSVESEAAITTITGTEYWNLEGESYQHGAGAYILKATAGAQTMDWSQAYGSRCNQALCEVEAAATGTNMEINIGDVWRDVSGVSINISDAWKTVTKIQINVSDSWRTVFG